MGRMTAEDFRALSPLVYAHVNPYGTFELDMDARLPIAAYCEANIKIIGLK